jgi:hypothetical protein
MRTTHSQVVFVGIALFGQLLAPLAAQAEVRVWSDVTGKFKITAEFVELKDDVVRLRTADGKVVNIPMGKLSGDDRQIVRTLTAPPVVAEDPNGPIRSLVRVMVPLGTTEEGESDEIALVGFALQTAEASPVIIISRESVPADVEQSTVDTGLGQAEIIALRAEDVLGRSIGVAAGGGGAGMSFDRGGDPSMEIGRDGRPVADAAPVETPAAAPAADAASLIILRTSPETRIPMLSLAKAPPAADEVVTVAKLPRPQVRAPGARRPPIPFTPWTVLAGDQLPATFQLKPQDGGFPFAGATLPVLNAANEVVGVMNPGFKTTPVHGRVASAIGVASLRTAIEQGGIIVAAPEPPPELASGDPAADPAAGAGAGQPSGFAGFLQQMRQLAGGATPPPGPPGDIPPPGAAPPAAIPAGGPSVPWTTDYEALRTAIQNETGRDGIHHIQWGGAADLGAWYEAARAAGKAKTEAENSGGRDYTAQDRAQQAEQNAAQALAALPPVEWSAVVTALPPSPEGEYQMALQPLTEPLRIMFVADPADARAWSAVQPGNTVRFTGKLSLADASEYPAIVVTMTVKEVVAR